MLFTAKNPLTTVIFLTIKSSFNDSKKKNDNHIATNFGKLTVIYSAGCII